MKYYYIFFWVRYDITGWVPVGCVIDSHPLDYFFKELAVRSPGHGIADSQLASWQEITREEYDRFKIEADT